MTATLTAAGHHRGHIRAEHAPARWLSLATAVLVAVASAVGLLFEGLYEDPGSVAAMFRGYDLVALVAVAPLLAATLLSKVRTRPRFLLVRLSLLAYCVYNYAYYVFGAQLNSVLLLHIATFATALYALVLALAQTDVVALANRFKERTPVRTVAVILLLLGVPLAAIWITAAVGFAISGTVPEDPSVLVVPPAFTRLGAVLDLSLLVPAYVLAAWLLWHRRAWGFVLATIVLASGALHQVSYLSAMVFQSRAQVPGASYDLVEPFIAGLFVLAAFLLLVNAAERHPGSGVPRRVRRVT